MKNRKLILISVTLVILVVILIYFIYNAGDTQKNKIQNPNDYISFTVGHMITYDKANDYAEYSGTVFEYDLQSKEISEIFSFPYNTQYLLGVYDKKANSVYYSKEKNNNTNTRVRTGDQIYVYNLATGSDIMLTEDLWAVNHIEPVDGAVFFAGAKLDYTEGIPLGKIDLSDGSIKYWDEAKSASVKSMSVDKIQKRIYVSVFDWIERDIAVNTDDTSKYTIYSFDYNLSDKREVLHKDHMAIKAVYARDNQFLYRADNTITPTTNTKVISEVIDLNKKKKLFQSEEYFVEEGNFSQDLKGVYVQYPTGQLGGISYYDFEKEEYTQLIKNDKGFMGNFYYMYYGEK